MCDKVLLNIYTLMCFIAFVDKTLLSVIAQLSLFLKQILAFIIRFHDLQKIPKNIFWLLFSFYYIYWELMSELMCAKRRLT